MKLLFKKENLKFRAVLNSLTTLIDFGARLLVTFFVTPFILNGLGSSLYGAWKVLHQIVGYGNLAVINSTESLKWSIAKDRNLMTHEQLQSHVTSTIVVLCLNIPVVIVLSTILVWYSPIIIGVNIEYYLLIRLSASILILDLITRKLFDVVGAVLRGMNIGFRGVGVRSIIIIISGFFQYLVLILNYGIVALATVQLFSTILTGVIVFQIVRNNVDWFRFGKFDKWIAIKMLKLGGWYSIYGGIEMTIENSDKILLSYLLGPVIVTKYVITEFLIKSIQGIINNITIGVMPGMSLLVGDNRIDNFIKYRRIAMKLTWILFASFGTVVIVFNESFIFLWVGQDYFSGQIINILILIIIGQYLFIKNDGILISSILKVKSISLIGLFSAIFSIALSYVLILHIGLIGLCIGIIFGRMVISIYYPLVLKKILKSTVNLNYLSRGMILSTLFSWSISLILSEVIFVETWGTLTLLIMPITLAFFLFHFYVGINKEDRHILFVVVEKIKSDTLNYFTIRRQ